MNIILKTKYILSVFVFFPLLMHANNRDSAMLRAERHYIQNEFTQAIAEYQAIADSGWTSAELYYNAGNACFKNHDIKQAILYYERAKRLAPNDEDINYNLNLSRSLIFDKIEASPEPVILTWGRAIRDSIPARAWAWWGVGFFITVLALGLLFLFVRNMLVRQFAFGLAVICFIASLVSVTFGHLQKGSVMRTDEAIVFAPSVTLKSTPDDSGNNLFILHEGVKVRIETRIDDWCEVRIADDNKGWMRASDLEVI